jgi:single-strand DNA-binding protein
MNGSAKTQKPKAANNLPVRGLLPLTGRKSSSFFSFFNQINLEVFFMIQLKSLNSVQLIGRLGKNAELRASKSGTQFLTFGVATEMRFKAGEEPVTTWHNCTMGGASVSKIAEMLTKGSMVSVRGYIRYRKDGEKNYTDIAVEELVFLSSPKDAAKTASANSAPAQQVSSDAEADAVPF